MSAWLESWQACWRPQDKRTRAEWALDHVEPPNSARSKKLDMWLTPWLLEPTNMSQDNRVKVMVILAPTGAGKTTILDGIIPHAIVEDPGPILLVLQTDPDAKEYVEERLLPSLKKISQIRHVMSAMDRHAIRKDAIMFPHMPLYMGGANLTNLQRKSVRYALGDEVWRWKHGYVKEFKARTHDRWNQRIVLVSQGGWTHAATDQGLIETELQEEWESTDKREWCFECPHCKTVQRFRWKALQYDTVEKEDGTLDEVAIFKSARYVCLAEECGVVFEDTTQNRRQLAMSGRYVVQNQNHLPGKHGWHCNALTLWYVPWGQLAVELAKAHFARKRGDEEPLRIFRQKRGAENYREEQPVSESALTLGEYYLADYANGELIPGEAARFLAVDVQRDHFWAVARALRADGSSRLIWEGKISTWEGVEELSKRLKVPEFYTGVDSGYDTDEVYNRCARNRWLALKGEKVDSFTHNIPGRRPEQRFYSTVRKVRGTSGQPCPLVLWSNRQIKRILEKLRSGYREDFEVPKDVSEDYKVSMFSELERDMINKLSKAIERRFVRIGNRPNHKWDCEAQIVGMAIRKNLLSVTVEQSEPESTASAS